MKPKRILRRDWRTLCGQPGTDDGVDPRRFFKSPQDAKPHRKTLQLCGQVRRILDYVLSGECDDELLRGLIVQDVLPAPDAGRLLVTVTSLDAGGAGQRDQILQRLTQLSPRLRFEIAQSIHRRKTPQLMFEVAAQPSTDGRGANGLSETGDAESQEAGT